MKPQKLSPHLIRLVYLLNDGQYHDGTRLGHTLRMTRSAVWKAIQKLTNYRLPIHSAKGKGYVLQEPCVLLNPATIQQQFDHAVSLDVFEKITSTNDYLKTFFGCKVAQPLFCAAEQQTAGRGRLNREWHSPFGQNIYLSCLYPFKKEISELQGLSLVVSLAVIAACREFIPDGALFAKWPNDVFCQTKKLAGNLIELQAESHGACCAVIGMGVNVNMLTSPKKCITQPWTSLRQQSGQYIDRNLLSALLMKQLLQYLKRFEKHGLAYFVPEWRASDYLFDQPITLQGFSERIIGIAKGVDQYGHLLLQRQDGSLQSYATGETSIE